MPHITVNGVSLAFEERGSGEETVVLSHSYLVDHRQFESQIAALAQRYRVLAFDHRGHGGSDKPSDGYDMDAITRDAEAFIEATNAGPCHFIGLSTGGFVGLRLGLHRPDLLRSLVLMDTSAQRESRLKRAKYEAMFAVVKRAGFDALIGQTMSIMFGPEFLDDPVRKDDVAVWRERILANDVDAMIGFGRAIFNRDDVVDRLGHIDAPTLVMVGEHDDPQPIERAQVIADGIVDAHLHVIPGAGHLSTIENPDDVNTMLASFLETGGVPAEVAAREGSRATRSTFYDGSIYGRLVEPLLSGVHGFVADNLPDGERVLDACCGTGGLAHRMADVGRDVTGVDLSPRNIEFAQAHESGSSVTFEVCDVSELPYEDDAFDLATVVLALHEMPTRSRVPVLRELSRVATRVLVVDYRAPMPRNAAGLRNRAIEAVAGRGHFTAFRDYSRRGGLTPLLDRAGLQLESERTLDGGTLVVHVAHA